MPGCRDQRLLDSEERTRRGAHRGQLGQCQGSRWRSPRPPGRGRARLHCFPLAEGLGTKQVRQVDLHASAGRSCFKLSKTTPCGADGREQVVLTVFLRPRGPGERALSTVARRGLHFGLPPILVCMSGFTIRGCIQLGEDILQLSTLRNDFESSLIRI